MGHKTRGIILGHNSVLNQLIAFAMRQELGVEGVVREEPGSMFEDGDSLGKTVSLILVDDADEEARSAILEHLGTPRAADPDAPAAAFFNVDMEKSNVRELVRLGVKGIFLMSDPMPHVLEGIGRLLNQEVWIPHDILVDAAMHHSQEGSLAVRRSRLTMREVQVLGLVCTGATNEQIAVELCLSPNTVKTHMYNIFKKLDVGSRLHAALWAVEFLGAHLPGMAVREGHAARAVLAQGIAG